MSIKGNSVAFFVRLLLVTIIIIAGIQFLVQSSNWRMFITTCLPGLVMLILIMGPKEFLLFHEKRQVIFVDLWIISAAVGVLPYVQSAGGATDALLFGSLFGSEEGVWNVLHFLSLDKQVILWVAETLVWKNIGSVSVALLVIGQCCLIAFFASFGVAIIAQAILRYPLLIMRGVYGNLLIKYSV